MEDNLSEMTQQTELVNGHGRVSGVCEWGGLAQASCVPTTKALTMCSRNWLSRLDSRCVCNARGIFSGLHSVDNICYLVCI